MTTYAPIIKFQHLQFYQHQFKYLSAVKLPWNVFKPLCKTKLSHLSIPLNVYNKNHQMILMTMIS